MSFSQITATLNSFWGNDRDVANQAWASTSDFASLASKSPEDVRRVVTQAVQLHHETPMQRVWLDFSLTAPIFVERQFDKYRMTVQYQDFQVEYQEGRFGRDGITQNELSGRYRTIPERPYSLPKDVEGIFNRACPWAGVVEHGQSVAHAWLADQEEAYRTYQKRLDRLKDARDAGRISPTEYKRARDVLRGGLGTSFLTDFRVIMNLTAFEHMMNQRLPTEAQTESRVLAYEMVNAVVGQRVAQTTVNKMLEVNGWGKYMQEIRELIRGDE